MANLTYLTATQKRSLLDWIGARGESYPAFIEWCEREQIPEANRYTKVSYRGWVQRRRAHVQAARASHQAETRQQSRLGREERMAGLERTYERLDALSKSEEIEDTDKLIRIEEQKRKTLEAIAKERGEWGVKNAPGDDAQHGVDVILERMARSAGNVTPIRQVAG